MKRVLAAAALLSLLASCRDTSAPAPAAPAPASQEPAAVAPVPPSVQPDAGAANMGMPLEAQPVGAKASNKLIEKEKDAQPSGGPADAQPPGAADAQPPGQK